MSAMTLYAIEESLAELIRLRELAEDEGDTEALPVIDQQIQEYAAREVKKVDSIAHAINTYELAAEHARAESKRLAGRAAAFTARADRIRNAALYAMQAQDIKAVETPTNTLKRQGNGGVQALDVEAHSVLDEFRKFTLTLTGPAYLCLIRTLREHPAFVEQITRSMRSEPDNERIREALKGGLVQGAKLLPRGEHLRLS